MKIVVPVDFSSSAAAALRFAANLSRLTGMQLQVVYVFNSLVPSNRHQSRQEIAAEQEALERQLTAFANKHTQLPAGTPIDILVAEGIPPNYVQRMSTREEVALIVIGGIGTATGTRKDVFGDIARTVAREGGCPLVIIPESAETSPLFTKALCGLASNPG